MGIGPYRHAVDVLDPGRVATDPPTWWCSIQSIGSQVIDGQAAYILRGRYSPDITLETQLDFEGRILQVQAVNDVDEKHVSMVLTAVEVRGRV